MSNPYRDDRRATFVYPQHTYFPETPTSLVTIFISILAGAYILFKSLDILGYPVWLWLHKAVQMSVDSIPSLSGLGLWDDSDSGDEGQRGERSRRGSTLSMFGLNSGGLIGRGLRGVTGSLSKIPSYTPAGLGNWDNSCYQNSVIQGLASLPSLREYLSNTTSEYKTLGDDTTSGALFEIIKKLNDPQNHDQHFWVRGILKSMSTFQQQDAQEYYSKITDALDKEVKDATNSKRRSTASWLLTAKILSDSPVLATEEASSDDPRNEESQKNTADQPQLTPNPLDGLLAQRVGCINCGYTEGLSMIPFNCVTVPLGGGYQYDVRECLDEYTSLEFIEGVECAKCTAIKNEKTLAKLVGDSGPEHNFFDRLQNVRQVLEEEDFEDKTLIKKLGIAKKNWVKSTKSRQAVIARAPKALVLHVNRSIFDEMTGAQYKNSATVRYPKILDLGTWCLGSRPSHSQEVDESAQEEWPRDPNKSMLGDANMEPTVDSPFQYTLRAAVTHAGSHGNGHYVCYRNQPYAVKKPTSSDDSEERRDSEEEASVEQWWRISDELVYSISEDRVLSQGGVFMLFYERIDGDSNPPPPRETALVAFTATDIPLPPQEIMSSDTLVDHTAAEVPLPDDGDDGDDILPLSPTESPILPPAAIHTAVTPSLNPSDERVPEMVGADPVTADTSADPTGSPNTIVQEDTENSDGDSEGAPSTALTSDDDTDEPMKDFSSLQLLPAPSSSPQWMRTAGDTPRRGEGSKASLPMVTAT